MDPSYGAEDDEADAMARFMGFSSFGTQGPPKKRKFNAAIDAMVEGQELAKLDRGGKKGQGSGGNNIPLGKQRTFGQAGSNATPVNYEDEIDLEDADEVDDGEAEVGEVTVVRDESMKEIAEEDGPVYIDTSQPAPDEEARAAQAQIDAILASSEAQNNRPQAKPDKPQSAAPAQGLGAFMSALNLPAAPLQQNQPPPTPLPHHASLPHPPPPGLSAQQQSRVRGERNPLWYVDYYDPAFNENPWAREERLLGLEPVGSWLERPVRAS